MKSFIWGSPFKVFALSASLLYYIKSKKSIVFARFFCRISKFWGIFCGLVAEELARNDHIEQSGNPDEQDAAGERKDCIEHTEEISLAETAEYAKNTGEQVNQRDADQNSDEGGKNVDAV